MQNGVKGGATIILLRDNGSQKPKTGGKLTQGCDENKCPWKAFKQQKGIIRYKK